MIELLTFVAAAAYIGGWLIAGPAHFLDPITDRYLRWLTAKDEDFVNEWMNDLGAFKHGTPFNWWSWLRHKSICRMCSSLEPALLAVGVWTALDVWAPHRLAQAVWAVVVGLGLHLLVAELLGKE